MSAGARRDLAIEGARSAACALVVLMHVNAYARAGMETWWPGGYAFVPIYCITVPAFLIVAGFLQARPGDDGGCRSNLPARLQRLLLPFLCWNGILLAQGMNAGGRSPAEVVVDVATGVQHLYYLGVLAQLTIAFVLLQRLRGGASPGRVLLLSGAISAATLAYSDYLLWTGRDGLGFTEGWLRRLALPWALHFFFGVWRRRRAGTLALAPRKLALLAATTGLAYLLYEAGLRGEERAFGFAPRTELLLEGLPFQLLGAWLLLASLSAAAQTSRGRQLLARAAAAARDSYGVYLVHFSVLLALYSGWVHSGHSSASVLEVPVFWALVYGVSVLLVRALRAVPSPMVRLLLLGEQPAAQEERGRRPSVAVPAH